MVNLTYSLDSSWQIIEWHSPDGSCDCQSYEGRSLPGAISDLTLRHLFTVALDRVVSFERPLELRLRCDTPDLRREAYVHLRPSIRHERGVDAENGILSQTRRPTVRALQPGWMSSCFLRMCSWCKRVEAGQGSWIEIEEAERSLRIFDSDEPPQLTHGLCGACYQVLARQIGLDTVAVPGGSALLHP